MLQLILERVMAIVSIYKLSQVDSLVMQGGHNKELQQIGRSIPCNGCLLYLQAKRMPKLAFIGLKPLAFQKKLFYLLFLESAIQN